MLRLKTRQGGDTIVEVMIVLAVLGLSIGIAYATANRSLLNARQAQESAEAASIAQSQVEQLRALSANASSAIYTPGTAPNTYYCISSNAPTPLFDPSSGYPAQCQIGSIPYKVSITYTDDNLTTPDTRTFTVKVVWDDVLGEGQDSTSLIYRVYPTQ